MYISRLVKTRDLYPGLLTITIPVSLSPFLLACIFPSLLYCSPHLFSYFSLSLFLLLVYLSGSATTPSHIQRGLSVAIPSVQGSKLRLTQVASTLHCPSWTMLSKVLQGGCGEGEGEGGKG
jgi:hypothetical protein